MYCNFFLYFLCQETWGKNYPSIIIIWGEMQRIPRKWISQKRLLRIRAKVKQNLNDKNNYFLSSLLSLRRVCCLVTYLLISIIIIALVIITFAPFFRKKPFITSRSFWKVVVSVCVCSPCAPKLDINQVFF